MRQRKPSFNELVNRNKEELMKDSKALTEIEEQIESRRQAESSTNDSNKENAK
ncbi:FbpB family small basic protein [Radiobacillus kanasensis]|uniref:FbpB family small basic protein n=1 Tax=Radiobacillus kanasensis TaxID=2844358 RepID=UPI0038B45DE6